MKDVGVVKRGFWVGGEGLIWRCLGVYAIKKTSGTAVPLGLTSYKASEGGPPLNKREGLGWEFELKEPIIPIRA